MGKFVPDKPEPIVGYPTPVKAGRARSLSKTDQRDLELFKTIINAGEHTGSIKDLINLTQSLELLGVLF